MDEREICGGTKDYGNYFCDEANEEIGRGLTVSQEQILGEPQLDIYRVLVEQVRDYAIFALDPRGVIQTWNSGAQRLKGYTPEEAIGRHFSMFYGPEDLASGKPAWELEVAAAEGQVEDTGWRLRKDGTRFWANVLITALRDEDGKLRGFAKVTRDLTEQRAANEEIRQSEERLRLLIQSVKDYAIYMLDPTGHIETWNQGAQRIKGYTAEEVIGKHFSIFYTQKDIDAGHPQRELEIAARTGEYEEEGIRVRKDGTEFWASVVLTPVRTPSGELAGYAKVTRDLTERREADARSLKDATRLAAQEAARDAAEQKAAELRELAERLRSQTQELEERNKEAEKANRAKSEFLAAMSHELRTPLNAIGGYAQLMEMGVSGPITEEQRNHLERIQRSQQHLLGIINDILNFSRMEAGQVDYDVGPVAVRDVIHSVAAMIEVQATLENISMAVNECDKNLVALADRSKLEQILINLLSNAIKFTLPGGDIQVDCGGSDDSVWISVKDTGVGIAEDSLEKVFAPFVQVGRTLATPKEGTGLGLAISRDLARAMDGELSAVSALGEGSTFTLQLPRVRA